MKTITATAEVTADHRIIVPAPEDLPPGRIDVVVVIGPDVKVAEGATVEALGWSKEEAAETRRRLASFAEDWEAPGMEVYDEEPPAR